MDTIFIKGLSITTRIGAHEWEQQIQQRLLIDLSIPVDFQGINDELCNTLDYATLCSTITTYLENQSFKLIETVANQLAIFIKETFNIAAITITVHKPQAVKNAQSISVVSIR